MKELKCRFCGSSEIVTHQYVGDDYCQACGKWQMKKGGRKNEYRKV